MRDQALVKKAMRGNPNAFGELIRTEQEYLYRMAFLHTRNEEDALDAVQESILRAYRSIKTLREPAYFRTWLTRIVINTAKELARKQKPYGDLEELELLTAPEGLSPDERMDLYAALEKLPEQYRDVIRLKYFDGLKTREIAERLDTPEGTISSWLHRAMEQLRMELKEEPICKITCQK